MTISKSATVAVGILRYGVPSSQRNDALIGDLMEELHHGRSSWWCWRQMVIGVLRSWSAVICMRKSGVLFAVLLSLPVPLFLVYGYSNERVTLIYDLISGWAWPWSAVVEYVLLLAFGILYVCAGTALYGLGISYKSSRKWIWSRLLRVLPMSVALLIVSGIAIEVIKLTVPFGFIDRSHFSPIQTVTNFRMLLEHIPIMLSAFFSACAMTPEERSLARL